MHFPNRGLIQIVAAAACLIGPTAASARWFWESDESIFAAACEEELQKRLKAPSTYRQIEASRFVRREATRDEFMGWFTEDAKARARTLAARDGEYRKILDTKAEWYDERGDRADYLRIEIEYEAENSFGVPLRSTALCEGTVTAGKVFDDLGPVGPSIDGETFIEWALHGGGS